MFQSSQPAAAHCTQPGNRILHSIWLGPEYTTFHMAWPGIARFSMALFHHSKDLTSIPFLHRTRPLSPPTSNNVVRSLSLTAQFTSQTVLAQNLRNSRRPVSSIQTSNVHTASSQNSTFISANQQQRGALALLNSTVYIPYGGLAGDCEEYYGTVVGIPLLNTSAADAYLASPYKGGLWSAPGVTTDGSYIYGTTGTDTLKHNSYKLGLTSMERQVRDLPSTLL
jgi:hypothetical protein